MRFHLHVLWATIVKVFGMSRNMDKYISIPYSKFGTGIHGGLWQPEGCVLSLLEELADAIDVSLLVITAERPNRIWNVMTIFIMVE